MVAGPRMHGPHVRAHFCNLTRCRAAAPLLRYFRQTIRSFVADFLMQAAVGSCSHPVLRAAWAATAHLQEEMYSFVTLAEDQNTKKGVVVLEA